MSLCVSIVSCINSFCSLSVNFFLGLFSSSSSISLNITSSSFNKVSSSSISSSISLFLSSILFKSPVASCRLIASSIKLSLNKCSCSCKIILQKSLSALFFIIFIIEIDKFDILEMSASSSSLYVLLPFHSFIVISSELNVPSIVSINSLKSFVISSSIVSHLVEIIATKTPPGLSIV